MTIGRRSRMSGASLRVHGLDESGVPPYRSSHAHVQAPACSSWSAARSWRGVLRLDAQARRDGVAAGRTSAALAAGRPRQVQRQGQARGHGRHRLGQEARRLEVLQDQSTWAGKDRGRSTCKQVDLNHDGKIDMVNYYDEAGSQIVLEEIDGDFDGKFDFTAYYHAEQAGARRVRHELRPARRPLEVLRGWEAGPHRAGHQQRRQGRRVGVLRGRQARSHRLRHQRLGPASTSGTAPPRSRKKRPAATDRARGRRAPAGGASAGRRRDHAARRADRAPAGAAAAAKPAAAAAKPAAAAPKPAASKPRRRSSALTSPLPLAQRGERARVRASRLRQRTRGRAGPSP